MDRSYIQQDLCLPPTYSILTRNHTSVRMLVAKVTWKEYEQWKKTASKSPSEIPVGQLIKEIGNEINVSKLSLYIGQYLIRYQDCRSRSQPACINPDRSVICIQ